MVFLRIDNLSRSFGKLQAVNDVSLKLQKGEILSIIGPNGAGKTTFFNLISGRIRPDTGKVVLKGEDITGLPPYKIVKKGVVRSFQISTTYPGLTVLQNIRVPILSKNSKSRHFLKSVGLFYKENQECLEILDRMNLLDAKDLPADSLSYGDRKKLELGMAVAMQPDLLLLDEPTAGMNPAETEKTIHLVRELAKQLNLTLILTEHDMKVVFSLAHRIAVMHYGKLLCEGSPEEIKENPTVRKIYLGEEKWSC